MNLYKNATHLMVLTLTLLVGLGSIEGLMAADQTPREKRHDRRTRRGGRGKSSLRRRRTEPCAEAAAHAGDEMGEDFLIIEITYTDGTEESTLLPDFFNQLYKTPCHYTCSKCNCCGILPHKTLGDIEEARIYTYITTTQKYVLHQEFTQEFSNVLGEIKKESSHVPLLLGVTWVPLFLQLATFSISDYHLSGNLTISQEMYYLVMERGPSCCFSSCSICLVGCLVYQLQKRAYLARFPLHDTERNP